MGSKFVAETVRIDPYRPQWDRVRRAGAAIRAGELVVTPTDTVYGIAGDPFHPGVAKKIFRLKRRPEKLPILLLIDSMRQVDELTRELPPVFFRLARRFWPGPLTMILPASERVPSAIRAGGDSVALRLPASELVRALVRVAGRPLTGTSANRSGRPAARTAEEARRELGRGPAYIIDGGAARRSVASTLVDLCGEPRVLREGAVPRSVIEKCLK